MNSDAPRDGAQLTTECCGVTIGPDDRFCPRCGWECRVARDGATAPVPAVEQGLAERLLQLADETEREAASYAETFAPSRRLEGRAEAFREAAKLAAALPHAPRDTDIDALRAYGEQESTAALKRKDREQYQFWAGWLSALDKVAAHAMSQWTCKAKKTADPPQDCDWPFCGCDPYADKVIEAIEESGRFAAHATSPPTGCIGCGATRVIGYTIERKPGPFCHECWSALKMHVAQVNLLNAAVDREELSVPRSAAVAQSEKDAK